MITTTSFLQKSPDFWPTKEEARNHKENKNTNERYPNFFQDIFHAGDEHQFQLFRDATNGEVCNVQPSLSSNLFRDLSLKVWDKYKNVSPDSALNTFRYIFHKFKKGIFVKISDNKLKVFLPFSKAYFINEWSGKIEQNSKQILELLESISKTEGRPYFDKRSVNLRTEEWYGNNCLIRYEYPLSEGDSNVGNVKNMLEELCARKKVPDIEFFINRRDFPILKRDGTEPYNHIWGSDKFPLVSHNYDKYLPILSMSSTERYADVLMPTWDDWARIQSLEHKYFPRTAQDYSATFDTLWSRKKPTAVFRGSTTGCGVDLKTNIRLKLAKLSIDSEPDENGIPYLDARITKWNLRPRKLQWETKLKTLDITYLRSKGIDIYKRDSDGNYLIDTNKTYYSQNSKGNYVVDPKGWFVQNDRGVYKQIGEDKKYITHSLTPKQQSEYKYIVNVDGHVSAFRLSLELSMGCVILLVNSPWKIWYRDLLVEYEHYVPVKEDLSDLIDQIKWCRDNDEKCEKIANNARLFFETYLQKDGVLDYMEKTLVNLKQEMGVYLYNSVSPLDALISKEEQIIDMKFPKTKKDITRLGVIPKIGRCYGLLQGMGWIIRKVITESTFDRIAVMKNSLVKNVRRSEIAGFQLAVKTTSDPQKMKEHVHEAFLGSNCLNQLSKYVPNFACIFGMYRDDTDTCNVISEFIEGETLSAYIDGPNFSFREFLLIIIQLCLALEVAQNISGFVHYDLAPWNIVLKRTEKVSFDYVLSHTLVVRIRTRCIPTMIDFGKSHAIVDGVHHGFVNMFKTSTSHDIITLLVKSFDKIIVRFLRDTTFRDKLIKEDSEIDKKIMYVLNFISGTKYSPDMFDDLYKARDFLWYARKYSTLVYGEKYELENRTPYDLVKYITKKINFPEIGTVRKYVNSMDKGNGRQVFEYILSQSVDKRLKSYVNVFSRLMKCSIPQPNNLFFVYYAAQSLERNLSSVYNDMLQFLTDQGISHEKYEKIYQHTMSFLEHVYRKQIETKTEKKIEYQLDTDFIDLKQPEYSDETFLFPRKVLELLENESIDDLSEYKHIIETILLDISSYKLNDKDREYYLENFDKLLRTNSLNMKNNSSNIKTLLFMSSEIYKKDKAELELKLQKDDTECDDAKEYLQLYDSIISKLK